MSSSDVSSSSPLGWKMDGECFWVRERVPVEDEVFAVAGSPFLLVVEDVRLAFGAGGNGEAAVPVPPLLDGVKLTS
jgi:hypothetical protein